MNTRQSILAMAALLCTSSLAFAHDPENRGTDHHHGHHRGMMHSQMKAMDANNDGLITKAEFIDAQEAKWNDLPKNSDGAISIADMEKARQERMQNRRTQKHEAMMQDHEKMMLEHEKMMDATEAVSEDETKDEKPSN